MKNFALHLHARERTHKITQRGDFFEILILGIMRKKSHETH